jgi:hypothetical protein
MEFRNEKEKNTYIFTGDIDTCKEKSIRTSSSKA